MVPASKRAAVAMIWRQPRGARGLELLLIRRAEQAGDPWSGQMALPGGRVEPGESPLQAALRETREEVGLALDQDSAHLGQLDELQARARSGLLDLSIRPFVFGLEGDPPLTLDPEEVDEALWIGSSELLDEAAAETMPYLMGDQTLTLPCLRVRGRVVWGLTYRMLQGFFSAVKWTA